MKRISLALVLSVAACSGGALDVGEDGSPISAHEGTGGGSGAVLPLPDWSNHGACPTTGEEASQFAGIWDGATEDYDLKPIVKVRMVITRATTDGVCGTISWGTDSPPPLPVTDPAQTGRVFGFGGAANFAVPGLTYTISSGVARDRTLRVSALAAEAWRDFCAMQDELHYFPGMRVFSCMPSYAYMSAPSGYPGDGANGETCTLFTSHQSAVTLPLKQCTACDPMGLCVCNENACEASRERGFDLDLILDRTLDGVDLLIANGGFYSSLRLERVP